MEKSSYAVEVQSTLVSGRAGTGKTQRLAAEVVDLVRRGIAADDILVFAASRDACLSLERRMRSLAEPDMALPAVRLVFEYALNILALPEAQRRTGRKARVLLDYEEDFLMQDLAVGKTPPRRLREMVKFFCRSMTELEPMEGPWFFSEEEKRVYDLLQSCLSFYEAFLPAEVGRAAIDFLSSCPEEGAPFRAPYVFVDDYQALSRALQCLAGGLATERLWIASDSLCRNISSDGFPFSAGEDSFAEANPGGFREDLRECHKSVQVVKALNALLEDEALGASPVLHADDVPCMGSFDGISFKRPHDEFEGIVERVECGLSEGLLPRDIAVASTEPKWLANIERTLRARGIPVARAHRMRIGGNLRRVDECGKARLVTLLKLAADPHDQLALRCWAGFGDHLANSALVALVREEGGCLDVEGMGAPSHRDNALIVQERERVSSALRQAKQALSQAEGKKGIELLETLAFEAGAFESGSLPGDIRRLAEALPSAASACDLLEAIQEACGYARFSGEGVLLGGFGNFAGSNVNLLVVAGMVNGLTPKRDYFDPTIVEIDKKPGILSEEMHALYTCIGKAGETLIVSSFEEALLVDAERLRLKVSRVRLRGKERVCQLSESECLRACAGGEIECATTGMPR